MPEADAVAPYSSPLVDAVRAPLAGSAPAGIDMAYEDAYLQLKSHVDAMGAATGAVDFGAIVEAASSILTAQSKDIGVACYLAFGLTRTRGFEGVAEGVAAVRAVAETFWEAAFPPLRRMRARQSALQFMAERLNGWAETQTATPADREALEHTLNELTALQAFTTETMGDDAPPLSGLARTIREALRRLPAPEPEAPPEPPPAEAAPSDAAPAATAPGRRVAPPPAAAAPPSAPAAPAGSTAFSTPSEANTVVLRAAGFHREQSLLSVPAALLVRAVMWGQLAQAPPAEGGRTKLPAPPQARRDVLVGLATAGNHEAMVRAGEGVFQESPFHFWLDLQRLVATSLAALGAPAAPARAAVVDAVAALVRRLPALPTLAYADGTPFADPLTVAWLDEIAAAQGGGEASAPDPALEAVREAQAQASAGDVPGAVAALVAGAGAPRDRFARSVAAAELCLGAGRADVALALLDDADEALRLHRLDIWDPPVARTALRLLHAACTALLAAAAPPDRKAALAARADDAFARLARLDPGLAMRAAAAPKKA
jgi:type VI secretion system protein VasJ